MLDYAHARKLRRSGRLAFHIDVTNFSGASELRNVWADVRNELAVFRSIRL